MTTKTEKILDEVWASHPSGFEKIRNAVSGLLATLIIDATGKGVSERTATDTYIDWLRHHMREEGFMS